MLTTDPETGQVAERKLPNALKSTMILEKPVREHDTEDEHADIRIIYDNKNLLLVMAPETVFVNMLMVGKGYGNLQALPLRLKLLA